MKKCRNPKCNNLLTFLNIVEGFCSDECLKEYLVDKNDKNNGGQTDYYKVTVPKGQDYIEAQDVIEDRKMNYAQGNILKVAWTFNVGRHNGTDEVRELNKIKYFVDRELERIKKEK